MKFLKRFNLDGHFREKKLKWKISSCDAFHSLGLHRTKLMFTLMRQHMHMKERGHWVLFLLYLYKLFEIYVNNVYLYCINQRKYLVLSLYDFKISPTRLFITSTTKASFFVSNFMDNPKSCKFVCTNAHVVNFSKSAMWQFNEIIKFPRNVLLVHSIVPFCQSPIDGFTDFKLFSYVMF